MTVGGIGLVGGEEEVRWKESHQLARSGQDSIGSVRVAADKEAGAYYVSNSEGRGRSA